jgi:hypothetical protein
MATWELTYLVEPWPDTPWDRRDLGRWEGAAAQHSYATVADRRSVRVSTAIEAEEEGAAIAAGRARVEEFFPPSRYTVQNPQAGPQASEAHRLLRAGAAYYRNLPPTR